LALYAQAPIFRVAMRDTTSIDRRARRRMAPDLIEEIN
jgi:hypothetical protein